VGVELEAPGVGGTWTPTWARGRADNGDDGGDLVALLQWTGGAGEERVPVGDGRARWRWGRAGAGDKRRLGVSQTAGGPEGRTAAVRCRRGRRRAFELRPSAGTGEMSSSAARAHRETYHASTKLATNIG
jgi:hypothetical protein